jgi:hypothetical protein
MGEGRKQLTRQVPHDLCSRQYSKFSLMSACLISGRLGLGAPSDRHVECKGSGLDKRYFPRIALQPFGRPRLESADPGLVTTCLVRYVVECHAEDLADLPMRHVRARLQRPHRESRHQRIGAHLDPKPLHEAFRVTAYCPFRNQWLFSRNISE